MEGDACLQNLFYISFRSPAREAYLQVLFTEPPQRVTTHPDSLSNLSQSPQ